MSPLMWVDGPMEAASWLRTMAVGLEPWFPLRASSDGVFGSVLLNILCVLVVGGIDIFQVTGGVLGHPRPDDSTREHRRSPSATPGVGFRCCQAATSSQTVSLTEFQ
jgi:hypothetical protein